VRVISGALEVSAPVSDAIVSLLLDTKSSIYYTLESHPTLTTVFRLRVVNLSANDLMLGGAHAILSSVDEHTPSLLYYLSHVFFFIMIIIVALLNLIKKN
jgi:hypothetical protein